MVYRKTQKSISTATKEYPSQLQKIRLFWKSDRKRRKNQILWLKINGSVVFANSELDLFKIPPTETSTEEGKWEIVNPESGYVKNR